MREQLRGRVRASVLGADLLVDTRATADLLREPRTSYITAMCRVNWDWPREDIFTSDNERR